MDQLSLLKSKRATQPTQQPSEFGPSAFSGIWTRRSGDRPRGLGDPAPSPAGQVRMSGVTDASLYLQLGETFDGLERPQHPQDPQGLDGVDVLAFCPSVQMESRVRVDRPRQPHEEQPCHRPPNSRYTVSNTCLCLLVEACMWVCHVWFLPSTEACNCGDDSTFRVVPVHLLQYTFLGLLPGIASILFLLPASKSDTSF